MLKIFLIFLAIAKLCAQCACAALELAKLAGLSAGTWLDCHFYLCDFPLPASINLRKI